MPDAQDLSTLDETRRLREAAEQIVRLSAQRDRARDTFSVGNHAVEKIGDVACSGDCPPLIPRVTRRGIVAFVNFGGDTTNRTTLGRGSSPRHAAARIVRRGSTVSRTFGVPCRPTRELDAAPAFAGTRVRLKSSPNRTAALRKVSESLA